MSAPAWFSGARAGSSARSAPPRAPECIFLSQKWSTALAKLLHGVVSFYGGLLFFYFGGSYDSCSLLEKYPKRTRIHLYFLALNFWLWDKPHYRSGTHQGDMLKNLRNVAVPGTGVPLHLFVYSRLLAMLFLLVVYPTLAAVGAIHRLRSEVPNWRGLELREKLGWLVGLFLEHLLAPEDWFTYWRINSCLASYHSLLSGAEGYRFENKWDFLRDGAALGIPVSPFLDIEDIVVKDRNEEGGLGIYFFKNALNGGDWIIQRRLNNAEAIQRILPRNAPLSTFRVMTSSSWSAKQGSEHSTGSASECIRAMSCVFRAGRAGASTDHSSILFDVDIKEGRLGKGTTNDHWYQLGVRKALKCPWLSFHDQTGADNVVVAGRTLPGCQEMLKLCIESHYQLLKDVPLVGWDVAVCGPPDEGQWLLEVNLSCNFFRGSFDKDAYFNFLDDYLTVLDPLKRIYRGSKKRS